MWIIYYTADNDSNSTLAGKEPLRYKRTFNLYPGKWAGNTSQVVLELNGQDNWRFTYIFFAYFASLI